MDKFYVKGTRSSKKPGLPQSKTGKDMEGFYTYPRDGFYTSADDARVAMAHLESVFPSALFFVEQVPHNFDGISIPGL